MLISLLMVCGLGTITTTQTMGPKRPVPNHDRIKGDAGRAHYSHGPAIQFAGNELEFILGESHNFEPMTQDQIRAHINQLKSLESKIKSASLYDVRFYIETESQRGELLQDVQFRLLQAEESEQGGGQGGAMMWHVHGGPAIIERLKPLTAAQKLELEKEKKAAEEKYWK